MEKKFVAAITIITVFLIAAGVLILGRNKPQTSQTQSVDQNVLLANTRHTLGDPGAPVTVVEFADYQCPACATAHPIVKKVIDQNKDKVYFVFRHYPLSSHRNAKVAAQACEAAGVQGKFWEMHDLLFENQKTWSESGDAKEIFEGYAQRLGLTLDKFKADFDNVKDPIERDYADGNKIGVDSTPTFFINGQKYAGVIQEAQFNQIISGVN